MVRVAAVEEGEETVESAKGSGECERQWRVRKAVESAKGSGEWGSGEGERVEEWKGSGIRLAGSDGFLDS